MSKWQAIVFDLDDTLYPERDYVLSGFRAVAMWAETHLDIPAEQGSTELQQLFAQGVRGDTFNRWLLSHGIDGADLTPQLVQVYREHTPTLTPFPGMPQLLDRLRDRYRLGIVSDGYLAVQQRKLAALGLADYFDVVVFSDQLGREAWKPSTRPFETVLERIGVASEASVYVADNPKKDFLGARRAGMATIWLRQPDGEYTHLEPPTSQHAPDLLVTTLALLEHAVGQGF